MSSFSWCTVYLPDLLNKGVNRVQIFTRILPLFCCLFILIAKDNSFLAAINLRKWPYFVFVVYIVISVYSGLSSPAPTLASWKAFEIIVLIYWASHVELMSKQQADYALILKFVLKVLAIFISYVFISALTYPKLGVMEYIYGLPWIKGIFPYLNPNTIGTMSAIILFPFLLKYIDFKNKFFKKIIFVIVCLSLLLSFSRTATLVFIISIIIYLPLALLTAIDFRKGLLLLSVSAFLVCSLILSYSHLSDLFVRNQEIGDLKKMSGRTDYWREAWIGVSEAPIIGGGLGTGSRYLYLKNTGLLKWEKGNVNVHSSFIEILLGAGFLGGTLLIISYISLPALSFWGVFKKRNRQMEPFILVFGLGLILLGRSFTSIAPSLFSVDMMIYLLSFIYLKGLFGNSNCHK